MPLPGLVRPMLAVARGALAPELAAWAYEVKWDGVRIVAYVDPGAVPPVRLLGRNDLDATAAYPELAVLATALAGHAAVLDGEVVALDAAGRPSFAALQPRMHVADPAVARVLARARPVTYAVFDLLWLDGADLTGLPWADRRARLESLLGAADSAALAGRVLVPDAVPDGPGLLAATRERGLEGVVAKRRDAPYRPGTRSPDWLKVKHVRHQEVVVGGWRDGTGRLAGSLGALLVGVPDGDGALRYAGRVGTGLRDADRRDLLAVLAGDATERVPFADAVPRVDAAGAHWVRPRLVGEVAFAEWTGDGRLRHPAWRGLRPDKSPAGVAGEP